MSRPKAPCMNCEERHEGCHGDCEKYEEFRKEHFDYNLKKGLELGYVAYVSEQKKESFYRKVKRKQKGAKK